MKEVFVSLKLKSGVVFRFDLYSLIYGEDDKYIVARYKGFTLSPFTMAGMGVEDGLSAVYDGEDDITILNIPRESVLAARTIVRKVHNSRRRGK